MKLKSLFITGALFIASLPSLVANIVHLESTYASGATFSGDLTFTAGYDNLVAVDGTLSGGVYGTRAISWIWNPGTNFASSYGPQYGGNFLMDGSSGSWSYFITLTWDFSAAPNLALVTPASNILAALGGNNVSYTDAMVSGRFASVPEGNTYGVALGGLALVAFSYLTRRKRAFTTA